MILQPHVFKFLKWKQKNEDFIYTIFMEKHNFLTINDLEMFDAFKQLIQLTSLLKHSVRKKKFNSEKMFLKRIYYCLSLYLLYWYNFSIRINKNKKLIYWNKFDNNSQFAIIFEKNNQLILTLADSDLNGYFICSTGMVINYLKIKRKSFKKKQIAKILFFKVAYLIFKKHLPNSNNALVYKGFLTKDSKLYSLLSNYSISKYFKFFFFKAKIFHDNPKLKKISSIKKNLKKNWLKSIRNGICKKLKSERKLWLKKWI